MASGCVLQNASSQTLQTGYSGAGAVVPWGMNLYDTDGFHPGADGNITIPLVHNGKIGIFTACLSLTAGLPLSSTWHRLTLLKGGSNSFDGAAGNYSIPTSYGGSTLASWSHFVSGGVPLATGDVFSLHLRTNEGPVPGWTLLPESSFGLIIVDNLAAAARVLAQLSGDKPATNYSAILTAVPWDGANVYDTNSIHDPVTNNDSLIIPSALNNKLGVVYAMLAASNTTAGQKAALGIERTPAGGGGASMGYSGFGGSSCQSGTLGTFRQQCQTQPIRLATGDIFKAKAFSTDNSINLLAASSWFGLWVYGDYPDSGGPLGTFPPLGGGDMPIRLGPRVITF